MTEATQLRIEPNSEDLKEKKTDKTLNEHLTDTITDELIIGLCGPIGTDINYVSKCLRDILEDSYDYVCIDIKLSDLIKKKFLLTESSKSYSYYDELIKKGNSLREEHGNDILAKLTIHQITKNRQQKSKDQEDLVKSKRVCYIVNSIKNLDEYRLLKAVYQNIFYFIGVFSPLDIRRKNLKDKGIQNPDIEKLVEIDSEQDFSHGQKVTKTFTSADYFLRVEDSHEQLIKFKIERFLDLIFGTNIITPNYHETAMYLASSSSANSACLSRQVGASITNIKGDVISVGWNDVPKFGGNLYTSSEELSNDHRCINKKGGKCFNDDEKDFITHIIIDDLIEKGLIIEAQRKDFFKTLRDSKIKDLIEFSRAVHAEMHAIINASQKSGSEMIGGRLYCTTYPCHNCARHIVASGITEIYYIEPYKKSLALKLHDDSITENENEKDRVKILMYDGVSPTRYIDLFKMSEGDSRKEKNGDKILKKKKNASPRKSISLDAIPYLEQKATEELKKISTFEDVI